MAAMDSESSVTKLIVIAAIFVISLIITTLAIDSYFSGENDQ